jgi:hypothetical protein
MILLIFEGHFIHDPVGQPDAAQKIIALPAERPIWISKEFALGHVILSPPLEAFLDHFHCHLTGDLSCQMTAHAIGHNIQTKRALDGKRILVPLPLESEVRNA